MGWQQHLRIYTTEWGLINRNFFFVFLPFLGPLKRHMEVTRLGVQSGRSRQPTPEPRGIWAMSATYTTAHGTPDPQPTEQGQGSNRQPHGS